MRITWKDGVTTLAAAGAVLLERAYFHDWSWPLISSTRWTIIGLGVLGLVALVIGYAFDRFASAGWTLTAALLGLIGAGLVTFGLIFATSGYVVLLMLTVVVFWMASIISHMLETAAMPHSHSPA